MKKIVITGVSSFLGFHIAKYLSDKEFLVVGTISQEIGQYEGIQEKRINEVSKCSIKLEKLDISRTEELNIIIAKICPDYWIHHAGWAKSYSSFNYDLKKGFAINVEPLASLYILLKEHGCKGIIITGSSAEYSDSNEPNKETDSTFPTMPYGLCKLTETLYAMQLANQYKVSTRVARIYIPYGHLDTPEKLIPSVISSLKQNEPIALSACKQKRDFIDVENLACGYNALLEDFRRDSIFDIFNLCSGEAIPLKKLLMNIANQLNSNISLLQFGTRPIRPGESHISYGNTRKATEILGWKPRNLQEGLKQYLQNFRD